jgi:ABC-type thiamin/hydroxymethylpyrimidine transport system permease subunit
LNTDKLQTDERYSMPGGCNPVTVTRITAAWGLSESALGGVLHAFRLPLRGMIISSIAVILISLIARFSEKPGRILRSTLIVVMIKALISPHTPLQAYLSVFLQGVLGEFLFLTRKFRLLSSLLLGIIVSLLNGLQKIVVITLIYGQNLWKTINDFYHFINNEWFNAAFADDVVFSQWIIGGYIVLHFIVGIAAGLLAYIIPQQVEARMKETVHMTVEFKPEMASIPKELKSKRWIKPSSLVVFVLAIAVILLSFLYPESSGFDVGAILLMLVRAFLVIFLWFYYIAPLIKKKLIGLIKKKRGSNYANEVDSIIEFLPNLKHAIASSWAISSKYYGVNRLFQFMVYSITYLLKEER